MRCLRSIFYANPWIAQRAFKGVVEISQNWLVVESQFSLLVRGNAVERAVRRTTCTDIAKWSGGTLQSSQVRALCSTPPARMLGALGLLNPFGTSVTTIRATSFLMAVCWGHGPPQTFQTFCSGQRRRPSPFWTRSRVFWGFLDTVKLRRQLFARIPSS